jgi:hypothetical protein
MIIQGISKITEMPDGKENHLRPKFFAWMFQWGLNETANLLLAEEGIRRW